MWPWSRGDKEANEGLAKARDELHDVQQRWPDVLDKVTQMDRMRRSNGFGTMIRKATGVHE